MMNCNITSDKFPQRKQIRIENYDYSSPGAYFITICTANREPLLWIEHHRRGELCSPENALPLSPAGQLADKEIQKLNTVYDTLSVDKYCIMPDHIHLLITISENSDGRTQFAPTLSRAMKQFKGSISKQLGHPIWQKSFYDHAIRSRQDYEKTWKYIDNNPQKYL